MNRVVIENQRNYHTPGCSDNLTRTLNAVFISPTNSPKHEISKSVGAIMLHRMGDIKFTAKIREAINVIDKEIRALDIGEVHPSMSEVVPNEDPTRRIDLVDAVTNARYEFVCSSLSEKSKDDCVIIRI